MNADLRAAGYEGTVSDRTVRNWLTGKSRWPHRRQRAALEALFNRPVTELGFTSRTDSVPTAPAEHHAGHRPIGTPTKTVTSARTVPFEGAQSRVGAGDVQRLLAKYELVVADDSRYGGKLTIEAQASALAGQALALQARGTASQRIRAALYGCAASFASSAMWAAIDGRRFDAAQRHFERASNLASMSGDSTIQFRIWSHAGSMFRHMARPAAALAANDVARRLPIARRDPMFASLGHARHAAIHGLTGDARAARQTIGYARDAFERADVTEPRPVWMTAVCDGAELEELSLSAHLSLGNYEDAEAHAHHSLALLRPRMQRDRTIVTARLALAQLGQGELGPAVATAVSIPATPSGQFPRATALLRDFGNALRLTAPSSAHARTWDQYIHDGRRNHRDQ